MFLYRCTNNLVEQGTPGGGSPGSCGGMSPLPPASTGGPASCGVSVTMPASPPPPPIAPPTPRTIAAPLLLPHTPAPTPPPLHPPNTPRANYNPVRYYFFNYYHNVMRKKLQFYVKFHII